MRNSRGVAVAALTLSVLCGTAATAAAETVVLADSADDVTGLPYIDVKRATVANSSSRIRVSYASQSFGNRRGTEILYLDTSPKRPGPELAVAFGRYSEGWVTPMRNWKRDTSAAAQRKWSPDYTRVGRCDRTVRLNSRWEQGFTPITVTVRKKPGCITSDRVRIHIRTATDGYDRAEDSRSWYRTVRDEFPNGRRRFTGWVTNPGKPKATFTDGRDPVRWWNDLRSVRGVFTDAGLDVTIKTRVKAAGNYGLFRTYIDVDSDGVPDYQMLVVDAGGGQYLSRVDSWDETAGSAITNCPYSAHMTTPGSKVATFTISSTCLDNPDSVRIAVQSQTLMYQDHDAIDWLGGAHAWSDPISAS